jgi:hypothetical protein
VLPFHGLPLIAPPSTFTVCATAGAAHRNAAHKVTKFAPDRG